MMMGYSVFIFPGSTVYGNGWIWGGVGGVIDRSACACVFQGSSQQALWPILPGRQQTDHTGNHLLLCPIIFSLCFVRTVARGVELVGQADQGVGAQLLVLVDLSHSCVRVFWMSGGLETASNRRFVSKCLS